MADIDKSLPNDKRPEEEVAQGVDVQEEIETSKGPVEVIEDEEGATVDFDPSAMPLPEEGDFFANLNELLPEEDTDAMGSQLQQDYMEYKMSRKDWERAYIKSLDYSVDYDSVPSLMGSLDIPVHVTHTLDFELLLPSKR